jgi:hypothetical protein
MIRLFCYQGLECIVCRQPSLRLASIGVAKNDIRRVKTAAAAAVRRANGKRAYRQARRGYVKTQSRKQRRIGETCACSRQLPDDCVNNVLQASPVYLMLREGYDGRLLGIFPEFSGCHRHQRNWFTMCSTFRTSTAPLCKEYETTDFTRCD